MEMSHAVEKSAKPVAKRVLKKDLSSENGVIAAFTAELEVLHNGTVDVHIGELRQAAKAWLTKKPKRKAKAEAVDTPGMVYLLA